MGLLRSLRAAVVLCVGLVVGGLTVAGGAYELTHHSGKACTLLSSSEVSQVMGSTFPPPASRAVPGSDVCETMNPAGVLVSLKLSRLAYPDIPLRSVLPRGSQPVTGLGDQAYCTSYPVVSLTLLSVYSGRTWAEITADTCQHARELARFALSRL